MQSTAKLASNALQNGYNAEELTKELESLNAYDYSHQARIDAYDLNKHPAETIPELELEGWNLKVSPRPEKTEMQTAWGLLNQDENTKVKLLTRKNGERFRTEEEGYVTAYFDALNRDAYIREEDLTKLEIQYAEENFFLDINRKMISDTNTDLDQLDDFINQAVTKQIKTKILINRTGRGEYDFEDGRILNILEDDMHEGADFRAALENWAENDLETFNEWVQIWEYNGATYEGERLDISIL